VSADTKNHGNPHGLHPCKCAAEAFVITETTKPVKVSKETYKILLAASAAADFSEQGFSDFFELIHGSPLHTEGKKWVKNIFDAIKRGRLKILQEAFRGSGKTTVLSKIFFAYYLGHHPHTTNCVIRVTGQKANETTRAVKELIESDPLWKLVFPDVLPDIRKPWGEKGGYHLIRLSDDFTYEDWEEKCRETHRPIGPTFIGYGYDSGSVQGFRTNGLLLIDDIHDKENTRSPRRLEDVKDFIKFQLLPIPVPDEGLEIWNFTPWLPNDAYAVRKETKLYIHNYSPAMWPAEPGQGVKWPKDFEREELKGRIFPYASSDDVEQWWHLGWPERWTIENLALKYIDLGHVAFSREYLLDLEATKGQRLKADWIHYFSADDLRPSWPVFFGTDYASVFDKLKQKDRDYFTLAVMRAIPGGGLVLTGGFRGHVLKAEALQVCKNWQDQYPTLQLNKVEAIGKGEEFYNDLSLTNDMYGMPLKLSRLESHGRASKGERFEDYLAPRFQAARIWVLDTPNEFIDAFLNEWLMYPNSEHDDCLDAVYLAAIAGEGFMPSKAERSGKKKKKRNLSAAWSNNR
jgi:hypothetical protein